MLAGGVINQSLAIFRMNTKAMMAHETIAGCGLFDLELSRAMQYQRDFHVFEHVASGLRCITFGLCLLDGSHMFSIAMDVNVAKLQLQMSQSAENFRIPKFLSWMQHDPSILRVKLLRRALIEEWIRKLVVRLLFSNIPKLKLFLFPIFV